jgi:hypothetical protein
MSSVIDRRARHGLAAMFAILAGLALAPALAQGAVGAAVSIDLPSTVTVGQTGLAGSLSLVNVNTAPQQADVNGVCNAGDTASCVPAEQGITLVPSCTQLVANACAPAGADAGVFALQSTGSGRAGTSCQGTSFDIALIDAATGMVRFTPQPVGAHVTLSGFGAACVIDFTFAVLRSPAGDQNPGEPGVQTAQAASHRQYSGPFGPGAPTSLGLGTANDTTVLRAGPPALSTSAQANVILGGQTSDQANLTGLVNPVAGATVTFRLYAPSDAPCAGPPLFTSIKPVTLTGTTATATSDPFTPTVSGVYRWIATYGGDANNEPVGGTCGAAGENVSVALVPPPFPAKLEIARARVLGAARRLDVLAPITKRASGRVNVSFQAAGRTVRFTAPVSSTKGWVKIDRSIPAAQARLGTGILRLTYPGDTDTQPQDVRLRAAAVHASLDAGRPTITAAGRLQASGRISSRARGVVRLQVLYEPRGQETRTLSFSARIANGRYSFDAPLEPDVRAQIATRRGVVHSYTLFTGYQAARMRGEMASFQVLGAP